MEVGNFASTSSTNFRKSDLFHILKTNSFTYCLICMEDVPRYDQTSVKNHLAGENHKNNVYFFFKLCVPRLFDDVKEETCINVVFNSELDAGKVMGTETCYIALQSHYWKCLLCGIKIVHENYRGEDLRKQVIRHIMSDPHLASIRECGFLYRFSSTNHYLRFYKAIVFCSYCDETYQIKTTDTHFHSFKSQSARSEW